MEFSIILEAQLVEPAREAVVLQECVEQARLAEACGFDRVWAVEHHCLRQYAHMSAPETFLAYVAGQTSRIRVGHGVVCLPFQMNHPIKVAERIGMLDVLSQGRVDFGVGKGATPTEAGAFGADPEQIDRMLEESFRMIPRMWREDPFSHASDLIEIPERYVFPKPVQSPHPPLYMACTREATLNRAGEWGVGALCLGFGGPDDIAQKNAVYRRACKRRTKESRVGEVAKEHLSALCPAIVLDDGLEARKIGHRGQRFFMEAITHWYGGGPPPTIGGPNEDHAARMQEQMEHLVAYLHEEKIEIGSETTGLYNPDHAYGTVGDAIGYVGKLADAGADEVMFLMQMGTVPQQAILETIRNIGEHVIPRFRGDAAAEAG